MKAQTIETFQLSNGLTVVIEQMDNVQSVAFSFLVPAGAVYDPIKGNGCAAALSDLITRGAGERDSKELSIALDNLGVQHSESVGSQQIAFTGAALSENLEEALKIYADIILNPHLPESEFVATMLGIQQALRAQEDEPRQKIIQELRKRCFDHPWGLPADGTFDDLPSITHETIVNHYKKCFRSNGSIIGIAGRVDVESVKKILEELFGSWEEKEDPVFETKLSSTGYEHIDHNSKQTHIGIAAPSVSYQDDDYYNAWAAVGVLSGGMSSRLFTNVREKKGLCYSINATLNSLKHTGKILCYAGTTNERAQETLDVTLKEFDLLKNGIEEEEISRCKARAKSSLVMQQESTMARASSIARDWYLLGRVTTLDEIHTKIEQLTVESVLDYANRFPAEKLNILTIGPASLEVPHAIS
jgi:predicted Zn-dependent peptidase